jgi:hypothetical protein
MMSSVELAATLAAASQMETREDAPGSIALISIMPYSVVI